MDYKSEKVKNEVLGKDFYTNNSGSCFVFEYVNYKNVLVIFHDPVCLVSCSMSNLKKGKVENPLKPTVCGVGYIGVGVYNSANSKRCYFLWNNMLKRCYSETERFKFPSYEGITVCEDWHNFQNFAEWCYGQEHFNRKESNDRYYHLDKDIINSTSLEYSPETCCFVPSYINTLFTKRKNSNLPVGVSPDKVRGGYVVRMSDGVSSHKYLGRFKCPEQAFQVYKEAKENLIKEMAIKYSSKISENVLQKMMDYKVGLTG